PHGNGRGGILAASAGRKPVGGEAQMREVFAADSHLRVTGFGKAEQFLANRVRFFFSQQHGLSTDWTVGWDSIGSPLPLGRGRTVHRLSITPMSEFAQQPSAEYQTDACCSLSPRERARVRGKYSVEHVTCSI